MKKLHSILLLTIILASLMPSYSVSAQGETPPTTIVEIQPDASSMTDTHICSFSGSGALGGADNISVGEQNNEDWKCRGLLNFDLSGLPYDFVVVNATLVLTVKGDASVNTRNMNVYSVYAQWNEEAAWDISRWYVPWQTPGAFGTSDVIEEPMIGTTSLAPDLPQGTEVSITLLPDDIESYRKQNYFGMMLKMETEIDDLYLFYSSDVGELEAEYRPKLILEYYEDANQEDPGWLCIDGQYGTYYPYPDCVPEPPAPESPYDMGGGSSQPYGIGKGLTAAKILCEPYPRCINDYPIYYRITWKHVWFGQDAFSNPYFFFNIPGFTDTYQIAAEQACGSGSHGVCKGVFEGVIATSSLPVDFDGMFTIGLMMTANSGATLVTSTADDFTLYLSLEPFDQNCADTWYVPVPDTWVIDPILETPLGINGTPPDYQVYTTVIDQMYMVRVNDGPWNDGTDFRTDAAVSIDGGLTWMSWSEFSTLATCVDVEPINGDNPDYQVLYFRATTETFAIRVNDEVDGFADNTNDWATPYSYTIGVAFELAQEVPCETQFTYDPEDDWIASVNLLADLDDVPVEPSQPLEAEEWYAIEVADGTWNEPLGAARIDMEFMFARQNDWSDLDESSNYVYCENQDSTVIFVQAPGGVEEIEMHLRVNDQDNNFGNNSGALSVNIYHTTYTHIVDGCELTYQIGEMVSSDSVEGNQDNGKEFAVSLASSELGVSISYGLEPGGTYMLETTEGPWWTTWTSELWTANEKYYEMQVRTDQAEWVALEEWSLSLCVVEIDGLGHKRMYFQVPVDGGGVYSIRVAGAGPFTRGAESWELYQVTDLGYDDVDGCSSYDYSLETSVGIGGIDAELENGDVVSLGPDPFQDTIYAVHIHSASEASTPDFYQKSGWWESTEDNEEHDNDLQLSVDNGNTWQTLPNSAAVLCYYYTPIDNELVFIARHAMGAQWRMRVNSETFGDNFGVELYSSHLATITDDPWFDCFGEYTKYAPAINPFEWIPVGDEEGIAMMPDNSYSEENDPDGDGIIEWGAPALAPDHYYAVTTLEGPWDDGDNPEDQYLAQLSSDGGENWYSFEDHPDVVCTSSTQLKKYWTAVFHVDEGQQWKIRVADTETDMFADNSGNLAFELWLVNEFATDTGDLVVDYDTDDSAFDVCVLSLVRPQELEFTEIITDVTVLGNYVADWIQYTNRSVTSYFAWCPRHTEMLINSIKQLEKKEPLATVEELDTIVKTLYHEIAGYDWDESGLEKTSLFSMMENNGKNAKMVADDIFEHILPSNQSRSTDIWDGGNLISFGNTSLPDYYYTCNNVFAGYLPGALKSGVCFAAAYWKETEASFWVQLTLDISALFVLFGMVKAALQSLIYMMTGVRPWTKSGALAGVDKLVGYFERQERRSDMNLDEAMKGRRR